MEEFQTNLFSHIFALDKRRVPTHTPVFTTSPSMVCCDTHESHANALRTMSAQYSRFHANKQKPITRSQRTKSGAQCVFMLI